MLILHTINVISGFALQFDKLLENIQLSKKMRLRDFDNLFWSIQTLVTTCNGNPVEKFKDYIITNNIPNDDLILNNMVRKVNVLFVFKLIL